MKKLYLGLALILSQQFSFAADTDTQLRLNQQINQQQYQQEKQIFKNENTERDNNIPTLIIGEQEFTVQEDDPQQLAQVLYLAVMQKQWNNAIIYLKYYKKTKNHDQALTEFAEAALARAQGNLKIAEQKFKYSLEIQPDNLMTELELARILFERQKNKESEQLFKKVKNQIQQNTMQIPLGVSTMVNSFLEALKQRSIWQGSIAFGTTYAKNINNASDKYRTLIYYGIDQETGEIVPIQTVEAGTPEAVNLQGIDYENTLSKRWSLSGHHGIALRGLMYGQWYEQEPDYNEMTVNLNTGYSYYDEKNQILFAPTFEHKFYAHDPLYNAYGLRSEWMNFIDINHAVKIEAEIKDFNYNEHKHQNGIEKSLYMTFWKILPKEWIIFGGFDFLDHNTEEKYYNAYQQQGLRLGLTKNFDTGFNATLFSSYRWRKYDKLVEQFEEKRHDIDQNYNLIINAPKWQFYGLTPTLNYRYNRNKSNVDWLYSYDKHNISLKLEHRF